MLVLMVLSTLWASEVWDQLRGLDCGLGKEAFEDRGGKVIEDRGRIDDRGRRIEDRGGMRVGEWEGGGGSRIEGGLEEEEEDQGGRGEARGGLRGEDRGSRGD